MTSWWEVVILVVAMIGSGLIGGIIGVRLARQNETRRYEDGWLPSISDARFVERRASVYFEVAVGWHAYLEVGAAACVPVGRFAVPTASRPGGGAAFTR